MEGKKFVVHGRLSCYKYKEKEDDMHCFFDLMRI